MSGPRHEFERLARAFAAREQSRTALDHCPQAEQLFEAAAGGLDREQRLRIVDHVSQCAECAEAWRVAMELGARPASDVQPSRAPFLSGLHLRWRGMDTRRFALAASLFVAVGIAAYMIIPTQEAPPYREVADSRAPVAQVSGSLPRDRFLLRWSPGPQGSTYALRLSTADLKPLFAKEGLTHPEFIVPAAVFEDVATGAQLLWQVEVWRRSGQRSTSETYAVTLE
ncbi:MAG: hypothetical protein ABW034_06995 [Steroidobacteraceae bacterium]